MFATVLGMMVTLHTMLMMFFLLLDFTETMSENFTAEKLLNTFVETLGERQKSGSFHVEVKANSMTSQFNKLFGREKPVHHILGGGKCMSMTILVNFL
jgi:hypothetical protein